MGAITISNLNGGVDVKSDPAAIAEDSLADCIGFDLTTEGTLNTVLGVADNDISAHLPTDDIDWVRIEYINSTRYILATTATGLYSNGTLVRGGFSGRFASVSFINNIYLTNGSESIRFDGTTCYQWGITAPTSVPTISVGTHLSAAIEDFEDETDWVANLSGISGSPGSVAADAVDFTEGTQSLKFTLGVTYPPYYHYTGSTYRVFTSAVDLTKFDTGEDSVDGDFISFDIKVDNMEYLYSITVSLDVGDGSFEEDYYTYTVFAPEGAYGSISVGTGQSSEVTPEQSALTTSSTRPTYVAGSTISPEDAIPTSPSLALKKSTFILTQNTSPQTAITPQLDYQSLTFWNEPDLLQLSSNVWQSVRIPKNAFIHVGDQTKTWGTVIGVKLDITFYGGHTVNVSIDNMKMIGGSDLEGNYWFLYSWGRTDGYGNIIHESSPARSGSQFNIVGPVTFNRHPFVYSSRPLSSDPQVDCGVFYALGGSLVDFWAVLEVLDNSTTSGTIYEIGDTFVSRKLVSQQNFPAPAGYGLALYQNKIWMVGDSNHPNLLRSSDILIDGTVSPESWPDKNGYDLSNNHKPLLNITLLNKQMVVRGHFGEWNIRVLDATDYTAVQALRSTPMGCLGKDSIIDLEVSNIYPSNGGFIESDGNSAKFVLPEVQPLINEEFENAIGANNGLISYFSYYHPNYGSRTAMVDLFRGKARVAHAYNISFDCMLVDPLSGQVYGLYDGVLYLLNKGRENVAMPGNELKLYIKSRTYRVESPAVWQRMEVTHNTGGVWYRLETYIDDRFNISIPFKSTTRTKQYFKIGPVSGHDFHFEIKGDSTVAGKIYFPIRIFHGGK